MATYIPSNFIGPTRPGQIRQPSAIPTPYMSPAQGGSAYVPPQTVGAPIARESYPMASVPGGGTLWNTGQMTPYKAISPITQKTIGSSTPIPRPVPTPQGQVLGSSTQEPTSTRTGEDDINQQVDDLGAIIDRDYETSMGMFAANEQGLQGEAGTATQQVEAEYAPAKTAIESERATNIAGIEGEKAIAQKQGASALQQARDLFRQIQQQNIAQLSGAGITSSSVAEALAERLGVETARRIAGVTGSLNEVMQNAAKELTRVNTYYKSKLTDLETQTSSAKADIQNQLLQGIREINNARALAASDKANRRAELISRAQSALSQLTVKAQDFAQTLALWNNQKTKALTPVAKDPNYYNTLQEQQQNLTQNFAPTGWEYVPNFNSSGESTGYILRQKKIEESPKEEDLY